MAEHGFVVEVTTRDRLLHEGELEEPHRVLQRNYEIYRHVFERDNPGAKLGPPGVHFDHVYGWSACEENA